MHYLIYEIRHTASNRIYIGKHQTNNVDDGYMGSGKLLRRAIAKYGGAAFTKTILFDCPTEEAMEAKEREMVTKEFCDRPDTFNLCEGGRGGWSYLNRNGTNNKGGSRGVAKSSALRQKGSKEMHRLLKCDDEFRDEFGKKVSRGLKQYFTSNQSVWVGRQHSQETKHKMSAAKQGTNIGPKNPSYGTMWITNGASNRRILKTDRVPDGWHKGRVITV